MFIIINYLGDAFVLRSHPASLKYLCNWRASPLSSFPRVYLQLPRLFDALPRCAVLAFYGQQSVNIRVRDWIGGWIQMRQTSHVLTPVPARKWSQFAFIFLIKFAEKALLWKQVLNERQFEPFIHIYYCRSYFVFTVPNYCPHLDTFLKKCLLFDAFFGYRLTC